MVVTGCCGKDNDCSWWAMRVWLYAKSEETAAKGQRIGSQALAYSLVLAANIVTERDPGSK